MPTTDWSASHKIHTRARCAAALALSMAVVLGASGCGSGSGSGAGTPPAPVTAAAISVQPAAQSVPMGLAATYSVTATGSALQYQWSKNGVTIAGATSGTYTTPPTAFADTGAVFTVTVRNSAGAVTSNPALLTVTARAPMAGDLRFQQVAAASTVNGWGTQGSGVSTSIPGRGLAYYAPSLGTPLYVGSAGNCATPPVQNGVGCAWFYSEAPLAVSTASTALIAGYAGDLYENFQADLQSTAPSLLTAGNGVTAVSPASVITSLDLEPASNLFAVSWTQSGEPAMATAATQPGFTLVQNSVAAADLQSAVTLEGAASRVITAISVNGSLVTYLSYAWQADTTTVYDSQVATASTAQAPTAAAGLAAQGYIITAIGQADNLGNLYLVGTRVQGDTMARPFIAAPGGTQLQLAQQGYAIVGVIFNLAESDYYTYLGER